jgi:hypothetical protein
MLSRRNVLQLYGDHLQQQQAKLFVQHGSRPLVLTYEASSCRSATALAEFEAGRVRA